MDKWGQATFRFPARATRMFAGTNSEIRKVACPHLSICSLLSPYILSFTYLLPIFYRPVGRKS
jgi:hypothetical protein